MARMTWRFGIPEHRDTVRLELDADDTPLGHIYMDGATLEAFISELGKCRSQLAEQVTPELDSMARIEAVHASAWRVTSVPAGRMLALRHPGLGWLGFVLEGQAKEISEALRSEPNPNQSPAAA
jgi:hypothetical protein